MLTRDPIPPDAVSAIDVTSTLQRRWGWLLVLGIVQILCGLLAFAIPVAASLAAALVFGAVLLVSGGFQAAHAFRTRPWKGAVLQGLGALLYIVAGAVVLLFPITGILTLTLVVAVLLIADGVVRCALAIRVRPLDGWGWYMAAGIASTFVGIMLLVGWPLTGLWAIGILLGANLLISGVAQCALAVAFRASRAREAGDEPFTHAHRHA